MSQAEQRLSQGMGSGGSTDYEHRDDRGMGNPPDEGPPPGGVPMDRDYVRVYDPRRAPAEFRNVRTHGQMGERGRIYTMETQGEPDRPGDATVPYYEVFSTYSRQAEEAIEGEQVPAAYRQRVKSYFDALKEGSGQRGRAAGE